MRMRPVSPMFTQSDTAPMVQKWVLLPTAPKMKARTNAPPVTYGASAAGFLAQRLAKAARRCFALVAELLAGYLRDQLFQRLARRCAVAHRFLRAGDGEHRVGRLRAVGPAGEQLALRGDRALVVALAGMRHADPVLRVRRERAVRVGDEEALHRRDRERVVAELELVERRLVGLGLAAARARPRRRPAGFSGARAPALARLLELAQARVDVEVELLLARFGGLGLVGEHLELAAHRARSSPRSVSIWRGELEQRAAVGRALRRAASAFARRSSVALRFGLELLAQELDAPARLVVVEQLGERAGSAAAAGEQDEEREAPHQYSPP